MNFNDARGAKLSPQGRYELRFRRRRASPGGLVLVARRLYRARHNLIPNPARRYSVGDRTPGLARDPDGGLTSTCSPARLGDKREPNWLPTSAEHPWFVILRMYRPRPR